MPDVLDLHLDIDVDAGSTMFDVPAPTGLADFVPLAFLTLNSVAMEKRIVDEIRALREHIDRALTHPSTGYLLEVSVFIDEFGIVAIPAGQIVYAVGVGTEPVDALAEHLRTDALRPDHGTLEQLRNESFFVWIARDGAALRGKTIPPELRGRFMDLGKKEAVRRNLLASWTHALPHPPYLAIQRAEYWKKVEQTHSALLADEAKRNEVAAFSREMLRLQEKANEHYRYYQETRAALAQKNAFLGMLGTVDSLTSIFKRAIELEQLISSKNAAKVGGAALPPPVDQASTVELTIKAIRTSEATTKALEVRLRGSAEELKKLDSKLDEIFEADGIELPAKEPPPIGFPLP